MAFVRRHRMVLIPLFLVVAAGLGVAFLLRSGSEEPAELQDSEPVVTSHRWEETVEARNDHMREWRVVRELEWTDAETGETRTEEIVSHVREVGSSLCYQDDAGDWQPSVPEWEPTGNGFKADRGNYQVHFGNFLGQGYTKVVAGKSFPMRVCALILSDATQSVLVGKLDPYAVGTIDGADPSKLVFPNAFRGFVHADLEYVLHRAEFHQNIRLNAPISLPEGFDANTTRLYVYTELWLDNALTNTGVSLRCADADINTAVDGDVTSPSESASIAFRLTEQLEGGAEKITELFEFGPSRVYDSGQDGEEEILADRHIWRDPSSNMTYLVEQVPHTWLADATYPVTLDYTTKSGTISSDQVWRADATYHVYDKVTLGSGVTLTIEPGTVIKFSEDWIDVAGAGSKIIAKGEPYNYIVFTSKHDDESGETISGSSGSPAEGDYGAAIVVDDDASSECIIEYCKIAYADYEAIYVDKNRINPIKHCIIHDCGLGLQMAGPPWPDVINNLIYDCSNHGMNFWGPKATSETSVTIANNTVDGYLETGVYGIRVRVQNVGEGTYYPEFDIHDNIVTDHVCGIYKYDENGTFTLSNNAYHGNTMNVSDEENINETDAITLTGSPYDAQPTGAYYLNDTSGGGADCRFAGSQTYEDAELDEELFTFEAPDEVDAAISTAVWAPKASGADWSNLYVSIGYHHNRIDYLVNDQVCEIEGGETLVIAPGTVIVMYKDSSDPRIRFDDAATEKPTLICNGTPDDYIIFSGAPEVSMRTESYNGSSDWGSVIKGVLLNDPAGCNDTPAASITYTRFIGLHRGIDVAKDSEDEIRHCIFERGQVVLFFNGGTGRQMSVSNCLFLYSIEGIIFDGNDTTATVSLHNCTFDGNEISILCREADGAALTVEDCLLTNCDQGIYLTDEPTTFTHDYNAFYRCEYYTNRMRIWLAYEEQPYEGAVGGNSVTLDYDSPYDSAAEWSWHDLWYLDQEGDCVNGGSQSVDNAELTGFPTKLDQTADSGTVDIGYHYPDATPTERVLVKNDDDVVQGLATYWPLDGSATDYSESEGGTRVDGTVTGATATDEAVRGTALEFDGSDDYIEFAAGSGSKLNITDAFSIEAWARPETTGAYEGIALKTSSDGSDMRYGLRLSDDGTEYEATAELDTSPNPSTVLATSGSSVSTESWTHLVATFDGSVLRLYEHGTEVGWTVAETGLTTDSGDKFWIGSVASAYYFDGIIDEVKVYDRCLSEWEVSCLAGGVDYIVYTKQSTIDSTTTFDLPLLIPSDVESLYIETYDATYNNPNGETITNPVEFTSLQDGINVITIYGRDFAGNLSDPTEVMIIWDTETPEITDDDVEFTDISPDGSDDDFDSTTITAYFGEDVDYVVRIKDGANVLWSYVGTGSWFEQDWDGGGYGEGTYTLEVNATDMAGNSAVLWTRAIRIDNTDPAPLTLDNIANVSATSFDVLWANPSPLTDELRYEIYLSQVDEFDWDGDEAMLLKVIDCSEDPLPRRYTVDWLNAGTKYYVKMVVRDTAGNPGASLLWSTPTMPTDDLFSRTWTMEGSASEPESFEHDSVTLSSVVVDSDTVDAGWLCLEPNGSGGYLSNGTAELLWSCAESMNWQALRFNGTGLDDVSFAVDTAPDGSSWTSISSPLVSGTLSAYWPFDEVEGTGTCTTPDLSDYENDADLKGDMGEANVVLGRFDKALEFDGTDDRLEATDSGASDPFDITGDITIAAWVQFDDTDGTQTIISKADDSYDEIFCVANVSDTEYDSLCFDYQGGSQVLWTWTPSNDRWYHITAVYDSADTGSEGKLYVDGVRVKVQEISSIGSDVSDLPVIVGARQSGASTFTDHLDGALDDVSIHSRALTGYEIAMLARGTLDTTAFRDFAPSQWIKVTATLEGDTTTTPELYDVSIVYSDMTLDIDRDGLTEREERTATTDIFDADTDDDGLRDGFEVDYGFDPTDEYSLDGNDLVLDGDWNGDGDMWPDGTTPWTNSDEQNHGTDPTESDSTDYFNGVDVNGTDVAINDFGPGSDDPNDPAWVTTPEIEVAGSTDSTLAWAIVEINGIAVRPHIYNGGDIVIEKVPLDSDVTELMLTVHNIYNDELDSEDPGYAAKPEDSRGPIYVAYDPYLKLSFSVAPVDYGTAFGGDGRHYIIAGREDRVEGSATVTWFDDQVYKSAGIIAARLQVNNVLWTQAAYDPAVSCTDPIHTLDTIRFKQERNVATLEVDLELVMQDDSVVHRTYHSPMTFLYTYATLLSVDAVDEESDCGSPPEETTTLRQYYNPLWYDSSPFGWDHTEHPECFRTMEEGDAEWTYDSPPDSAKAFERSYVEVRYEDPCKAFGTTACDWLFQMPPHRRELLMPKAVLKMSGSQVPFYWGFPSYTYGVPNGRFGQSDFVVSDHSVMGSVLWTLGTDSPPQCYITCDSLSFYQPTALYNTSPQFADSVWNLPGQNYGSGYWFAFSQPDFDWFYILVEDYWQDGDQDGEHDSLIPNCIYVEGSATPVDAEIDTDTGPDDDGVFDWTEYEKTYFPSREFISVISDDGQGQGNDDGQVTVKVWGNEWSLPPGEVGETIAIPLDVEYHWPEADKSVTTAHKTVYAQKGIVVRVQVPEEIWAGESRPIFAVLNGKYNDGAAKCGDVPWTYPIRWEVALPELTEENGTITGYEPPGEDFTTAYEAVARHCIKQSTSPLYVGDTTGIDPGVVYVRAVIDGVSVNNDGEVVQSGGTSSHDVTSAWCEVRICQTIDIVSLDGEKLDYTSTYPNDDGEGRGKMTLEEPADELYGLVLFFDDELSPSSPDTLTIWMRGVEYELSETESSSPYDPADDSRFFRYASGNTVCTVELLDYTGFETTTAETLEVEAHFEDGTVNATGERTLDETTDDSLALMNRAQLVSAGIYFSGTPTSNVCDTMLVSLCGLYAPWTRTRVLQETGVDSLCFSDQLDAGGLRVWLKSSAAFDPETRDDLTVLVSASHNLAIDGCTLELRETDDDSLLFVTQRITGQEDFDYPAIYDTNIVRVSVKRFPAVAGDALTCKIAAPEDEITVPAVASAQALAYKSDPVMPTMISTNELPGVDAVPPQTHAFRITENRDEFLTEKQRNKRMTAWDSLMTARQTLKPTDPYWTWSYAVIVKYREKENQTGTEGERTWYWSLVALPNKVETGEVVRSRGCFYFGLGHYDPSWPPEGEGVKDPEDYAIPVEHENYTTSKIAFDRVHPKTDQQGKWDKTDESFAEELGLSFYGILGLTYGDFVGQMSQMANQAFPLYVLDLHLHGNHVENGVKAKLVYEDTPITIMNRAENSIQFYSKLPSGNIFLAERFVRFVSTSGDHEDTTAVFDSFGDRKLRPVFVFLNACSPACDRWEHGAPPWRAQMTPVERWRRLFHARALVTWDGVSLAYMASSDKLGAEVYKQPAATLSSVVGSINTELTTKAYKGEGDHKDLKEAYEDIAKWHAELKPLLYATMKYATVDTEFTLNDALKEGMKWDE